jgi:hypothetical protein
MLGSQGVFGSRISTSARIALKAYQGVGIPEMEENQTSPKEDFALAIEEIYFFIATEDGELLLSHTKNNPVSCVVWLDSRTLQYLRDKTFGEGASVREIVFNTGQKVITS